MAARLSLLLLALVVVSGAPARAQAVTPAEALVGQQVVTCPAGVPLAVTVTSGLWWPAIAGVAPAGGDRWLILFYDARNLGTADGRVAGALRVRDDQGHEAVPEDAAGPQSTFLATFYDVDDASISVLAGTTTSAFTLFAVAEEAQGLTLLPDPADCP